MSLSVLTDIFPDESVSASFIGVKDNGSSGDRRTNLQSKAKRHHKQQTITDESAVLIHRATVKHTIVCFTCTPIRSSAIGMSHSCLCLPSYNWYSFTDPGGMEG